MLIWENMCLELQKSMEIQKRLVRSKSIKNLKTPIDFKDVIAIKITHKKIGFKIIGY